MCEERNRCRGFVSVLGLESEGRLVLKGLCDLKTVEVELEETVVPTEAVPLLQVD